MKRHLTPIKGKDLNPIQSYHAYEMWKIGFGIDWLSRNFRVKRNKITRNINAEANTEKQEEDMKFYITKYGENWVKPAKRSFNKVE